MIDIDAMIRRQAYLMRYSKGYSNDIVKASVVGDKALLSLIRDFMGDSEQNDINALIRRNTRNKKVKALLSQIDKIVIAQKIAVTKKAESEMSALAKQEIIKTNAAFDKSKKISVNPKKILNTPVLGASITGTYATLFALHLNKVKVALINAVQNNQNPIDTIKGTRDQRFKNGLLFKRERDLRLNAETQAYGVSGNARKEVFKSYNIEEEVILSTLDHRTCLVCLSYDREVYKAGEGPYPPFHPRCRCVRTPWYGDKELRPFVEDERSVKNIPLDERKGKIGTTKYDGDQWFDRQPASFKRKHLGKTKYEAYKSGKLSLDDMVNGNTNRVYTLEDLELSE